MTFPEVKYPFKYVLVFLLSQVAVKIIDKTQLNSSSLQKVSLRISSLYLYICLERGHRSGNYRKRG